MGIFEQKIEKVQAYTEFGKADNFYLLKIGDKIVGQCKGRYEVVQNTEVFKNFNIDDSGYFKTGFWATQKLYPGTRDTGPGDTGQFRARVQEYRARVQRQFQTEFKTDILLVNGIGRGIMYGLIHTRLVCDNMFPHLGLKSVKHTKNVRLKLEELRQEREDYMLKLEVLRRPLLKPEEFFKECLKLGDSTRSKNILAKVMNIYGNYDQTYYGALNAVTQNDKSFHNKLFGSSWIKAKKCLELAYEQCT
jgi:hypothetical protein